MILYNIGLGVILIIMFAYLFIVPGVSAPATIQTGNVKIGNETFSERTDGEKTLTYKLVEEEVYGRKYTPSCLASCGLLIKAKFNNYTEDDLNELSLRIEKEYGDDLFKETGTDLLIQTEYTIDRETCSEKCVSYEKLEANMSIGVYPNCTTTCSKKSEISRRYEWVDSETYFNFLNKEISNEFVYIYFWAKRKPSLGNKKSDAIPTISGFELDEYAWWNSNWAKCKNITWTNNSVWEEPLGIRVYIDDIEASNYTKEIRIIDQPCSEDGDEKPYTIIDNTSADVDLFYNLDNSTDLTHSIYYDYASASEPTYTDLVVANSTDVIGQEYHAQFGTGTQQHGYYTIENLWDEDGNNDYQRTYGLGAMVLNGGSWITSGACTKSIDGPTYAKYECLGNASADIYVEFASHYINQTFKTDGTTYNINHFTEDATDGQNLNNSAGNIVTWADAEDMTVGQGWWMSWKDSYGDIFEVMWDISASAGMTKVRGYTRDPVSFDGTAMFADYQADNNVSTYMRRIPGHPTFGANNASYTQNASWPTFIGNIPTYLVDVEVESATAPAFEGNATSFSTGDLYDSSVNYGFEINIIADNDVFYSLFQLGQPNGTLVNYTTTNVSEIYYTNFTGSDIYGSGTYNYTWYANDTTGTWGSFLPVVSFALTDPPFWFSNETDIAEIYDGSTLSYFNITWEDTETFISHVWIESDYSGTATNYTMNQDSLVAAWHFESVDASNDTFGYGEDKFVGKLYNFSTDPASTSTGKISQGIDFESLNHNYINVTDEGTKFELVDSDFSIECWFKAETWSTSTDWGRIVHKVYDADNGYQLLIQNGTNPGNHIHFQVEKDGIFYNATSTSNTTELWYHIVATWDVDSNTAKIYVNGTEEDEDIYTQALFDYNETNLLIGRRSTDAQNDGNIDGILDELKIYNKTLTASEVSNAHANNSYKYVYNDLITIGSYYWKSYANDSSGNWNTSDTWSFSVGGIPTWSNNVTSIPGPYDGSNISHFNISWTGDNDIDTVILESNYSDTATNYTLSNITPTVYNHSALIVPGFYYWKSYANDTSDNWNTTEDWIFKALGWNQTDIMIAGGIYKYTSIDASRFDGIPVTKTESSRIQDTTSTTTAGGTAYSAIPINTTWNASDTNSTDTSVFTDVITNLSSSPSGWTESLTNWEFTSFSSGDTNNTNATFTKSNVIQYNSNVSDNPHPNHYFCINSSQQRTCDYNYFNSTIKLNNSDTIAYSGVFWSITDLETNATNFSSGSMNGTAEFASEANTDVSMHYRILAPVATETVVESTGYYDKQILVNCTGTFNLGCERMYNMSIASGIDGTTWTEFLLYENANPEGTGAWTLISDNTSYEFSYSGNNASWIVPDNSAHLYRIYTTSRYYSPGGGGTTAGGGGGGGGPREPILVNVTVPAPLCGDGVCSSLINPDTTVRYEAGIGECIEGINCCAEDCAPVYAEEGVPITTLLLYGLLAIGFIAWYLGNRKKLRSNSLKF